ncbi:unnamed protein product [Caenorhabditis angaria]|uniref:C2H2-type domain-containing protein n=1 Tax=Caenorhabditis angaria TaxID=860376 RepID=A0A9P1N1G2_9PELO|nr:unnamed protein product [Caenorhabditis angaria]
MNFSPKIEIVDSTTEEDYSSNDEAKSSKNELKRPDLKGSFRCSICSKIFCHSSSLSRHRMQAHFKSYKCTVCKKDISSSESLRSHMFKQHHISRMYMCRCCNWAFPDKSLLHLHLQTSSNSRISVISDPYQLTQSPIFCETNNNNSTNSLLIGLPKPIPTTTPVYLTECPSRTSSQSPSFSGSFKSDSQTSAFHQLAADRSAPTSPSESSHSQSTSDCFDCHVNKTRLNIAENKCKYLESRARTLQNEAVDAHSQLQSIELGVHRLRAENLMLREHNEIFQRKLLECQALAVRFLQKSGSANPTEIQQFLNFLVNSTIIGS